MKKTRLLCTLLAIVLLPKVWSSTPIDTSFTFNGVKHPLNLSIPADYDTNKVYPMVLVLHWCPGTQVAGYAKDFRNAFANFADSMDAIIACPDNFGNSISDAEIGILRATIDTVGATYKIDTNRVYLNGMSCNGYVTVRQGLNKAYPFKGVFAWDPWIIASNLNDFNYNSTMPITLAIGSSDQNYNTVLRVYDSLESHGANVNLVIVENVGHVLSFPSFTQDMIRSYNFLNDTNTISISSVDDFEMDDTTTSKSVTLTVANTTGKNLTYRAVSSKTSILGDPLIETIDATHVKITLSPKKGKGGTVKIVFEADETGGNGIEQIIFNVKVNVVTLPNATKDASAEDKLVVYPNPASMVLNINSTLNLSKIEICDLTGRLIVSKTKADKNNQVDIATLSPGIYFVKAEGENFSETRRFVKE
jgi:hypothetical protein